MLVAEVDELLLGARIEHAAAADDQRLARRAQRGDRLRRVRASGARTARAMHALVEEGDRIVIGLGLHVLAEGQRHRPAIGRVGEHDKRPRQRRHDLLGARDAVEIARHRAEAIVGADCAVAEVLDLLEHRVGAAIGEDIARQQQHRQAIDVGERCGSDHIGCARANRGGAGHHAAAARRLGEGDCGMRHRLLVVGAIGRQYAARRVERFAHARHIAVAEDCEHAGEERDDPAVDFGLLRREEADGRLGGGETDRCHVVRLRYRMGWPALSVRLGR